jgi:hypothetical protein
VAKSALDLIKSEEEAESNGVRLGLLACPLFVSPLYRWPGGAASPRTLSRTPLGFYYPKRTKS